MSIRGHTDECIAYWRDVMTAASIRERWDHWDVPPCRACDLRRATKIKHKEAKR